MDNVDKALQVVKRIDDSPDLVDIMISIEDYLDRNDLYAFKNWILGELVDGPHVSPYWIKVTFKWDYDKMPDPSGGLRLLPQGTKIRYMIDKEMVPQPIHEPSDYEPGTHKPKIKPEKVWLVEFTIPRRFVEDIESEIMDLYDDRVDDMETVEDAEAEGNTEGGSAAGETEGAGEPQI
jgi:hypothetical protein